MTVLIIITTPVATFPFCHYVTFLAVCRPIFSLLILLSFALYFPCSFWRLRLANETVAGLYRCTPRTTSLIVVDQLPLQIAAH